MAAFFIPKLRHFDCHHRQRDAALIGFIVFYVLCGALNWWYYARKGAEAKCSGFKQIAANRPFIGGFFMAAGNQRLPFCRRIRYMPAGRLSLPDGLVDTHRIFNNY